MTANEQPNEPDFVFFAPLGNAADPKTTAGLVDLVQAHASRLNRQGERFAGIEKEAAELEERLDEVEKRLNGIDAALDMNATVVARLLGSHFGALEELAPFAARVASQVIMSLTGLPADNPQVAQHMAAFAADWREAAKRIARRAEAMETDALTDWAKLEAEVFGDLGDDEPGERENDA